MTTYEAINLVLNIAIIGMLLADRFDDDQY